MNKDKMKNRMVIKNLPSNIVDEAIVILKPNVNLKSLDKIDKKNSSRKTNKNNSSYKGYIINEAEMVISNYISKIEHNENKGRKGQAYIEMKCKILKGIALFLTLLLIGSCLIK